MIFENLDKTCKLSDSTISIIKAQNPKVEDIEDIMLEVSDSWGFEVSPWYKIKEPKSNHFVELTTQKVLDYFGMSEGDFDDPEGDYKSAIEFIDDIRTGKKKNLVLEIEFQYANEMNGYKPLKQTDEQRGVLSEVESRLKSMGCEVDYEFSPEGSSLGEGLWKIMIEVPIKFQPETVISKLDGFSGDFIKDFNQFVKDYNIDKGGQVKLSNLIRRAR